MFTAELERHAPQRPRPIPLAYRPMATAIVGDRPVHVSTSTASRRALATVGKRAATTGDTIHLATPYPAPEVIAHELTHVAHPSPLPRFFDDDVRGPEERHAEQVAAIIRRSPILPRTAAAGRTSGSPARQPQADTVSAADLATSIAGGQRVQRVIGGHRTRGATAPPSVAPAIGSHRQGHAPATQPVAAPPQPAQTQPPITPQLGLDGQFERILELLEDRIITELERRGGRFRGGF